MNTVEIRLGPADLVVIIVGLLGILFLMLANLVNAFSLGGATMFIRIGWVIVAIALFSFTGLVVLKLARSGASP